MAKSPLPLPTTPRENYLPLRPLRWLPQIWKLAHRRLQPHVRIMMLSALVGLAAGLGAILFYYACLYIAHYSLALIAGYDQPAPGGEPPFFPIIPRHIIPWLLIVVPAVGGLFSGLIVYTLAPEAEGHGTDAAIDAYHNKGGNIRARVPIVKIIASAITLGTGGSGGREGPIAQIGAGFGSFLGRVLHLLPKERRILMAAGMGAGIAAIFRAPLAGALFAAEVLYRSPDFESEVVIPAGLASVIAYCTFAIAFGWNSLFFIPVNFLDTLTFNNPLHLIGYTLLVPAMVILATVFTHSFYGITNLFKKMPLKPHFRPLVGALITGLIAVAIYYFLHFLYPTTSYAEDSLANLSFGYGILQKVFLVDTATKSTTAFAVLLLLVALGKTFTTGFTIGSGGSGGVFGPSMIIGGCGGGALGIFLHNLWPAIAPHPASFVIVGMAGFFSAAAKTPFSTLIIVSEMTGGYNMLLPTLWVCTLCFLLSDEKSIYQSQVDSPARSPAHQGDYIRTVLMDLFVKQFIKTKDKIPSLHPTDSLLDVITKLAASTYQTLPVTDAVGKFLGVVTLDDVHLASQTPNLQSILLATDLMRTRIVPLQPDHHLDEAVELFVESNLDALPVINPENKLLGIIRRTDISRLYLERVHGLKHAKL